MDSFVIIKKQKKSYELSLRDNEINNLKRCLDEGKNVFLCGTAGCGKTFILKNVLDETNSVEIWDEPMRKKDIYLDTIKKSNMYAYIEDYDSDLHTYKHIVESVSDGNTVTNKQLIVTSRNVYFMENFTTLIIQRLKPEKIATLKPKHINTLLAAHKCKGNIHNYFHYLDYTGEKDIFKTPKEIVTGILCNSSDIDISDSIHEHGHIWSIIEENYPDAILENYDKIAYSLTNADLLDTEIYHGDWDIMPYFVLHAIKIPKHYFVKQIDPESVRPGRFWTKYGNQKMRQQKIRGIQVRSPIGLGQGEFMLLREYAKKGNVSHFKKYNLTPQDFDVMNHLAIQNKLKQREVTKIKKLIKEEIAK